MRLSDHMLDASPVGGYGLGYDGPLTEFERPWQRAMTGYGVSDAYARTFNSPSKAGGFTVYAFQLRTEKSALAAAAYAYGMFVCKFGADPMTIPGQPGIVVGVRQGESTIAWWVHGARVIEVDYAMDGERDADLAAALMVVQAAREIG